MNCLQNQITKMSKNVLLTSCPSISFKWTAMILKDGKITRGLNDPNQLIEPATVDFIFIPEIHRLGLQKGPKGPTGKQFEEYLNAYLKKFTDKEDILEIILEKDEAVIQEIFTAKSVYSISYKISYTNDDLTKDFGEEFDEQLKKAKIGEISVVAKSDNITEGLNIHESLLLKGGLELAEKNGEIRNATIVRPGRSKKVKISNTDKPKIESFEDDDKGNKWMIWANRLLSIYK